MPDNLTIYTIGHSNHPVEHFIAMLCSFGIKVLADIRSMPGSRKWPQFNQYALSNSLNDAGIEYIHMPGLGGRRRPNPASVNTAWHNKAFMGYADYMETTEFKEAIHTLEEVAGKQPTAYMCAEALWWRCHRSLVSDYLKAHIWNVCHIMDINKCTSHHFTAPATVIQGDLFYTPKN